MSDTDLTSGEDQATPPADDASALDHIIDETEERGECREWIHREFVNGRGADSILAELLEKGWPADDAEGLVEEGRRATRHLRGGMTREDAARIAEKRYRKSTRTAFRIALGGFILIILFFGWFIGRYGTQAMNALMHFHHSK